MTARGRPTKFSAAVAQEISERLSAGEPLAQICRDEHLPAARTVHTWKENDAAFSALIGHARDDGHDVIATNTRRVAKGEPGYSTGDVQRDKLIIETDLKLLAKWDKRYGDKLAHVGGGADDPPIATKVTVEFVKPRG